MTSTRLKLITMAALLALISACAKYRLTDEKKKSDETITSGRNIAPDPTAGVGSVDGDKAIWRSNDGKFVITASPRSTLTGEIISFTGICEDGSSDLIEWDFADGKTATGANPTHIYTAEGSYTVVARCNIPHGKSYRGQLSILISKAPVEPIKDPCGCGWQNPGQNPSQN